jgi:hypothetical protein
LKQRHAERLRRLHESRPASGTCRPPRAREVSPVRVGGVSSGRVGEVSSSPVGRVSPAGVPEVSSVRAGEVSWGRVGEDSSAGAGKASSFRVGRVTPDLAGEVSSPHAGDGSPNRARQMWPVPAHERTRPERATCSTPSRTNQHTRTPRDPDDLIHRSVAADTTPSRPPETVPSRPTGAGPSKRPAQARRTPPAHRRRRQPCWPGQAGPSPPASAGLVEASPMSTRWCPAPVREAQAQGCVALPSAGHGRTSDRRAGRRLSEAGAGLFRTTWPWRCSGRSDRRADRSTRTVRGAARPQLGHSPGQPAPGGRAPPRCDRRRALAGVRMPGAGAVRRPGRLGGPGWAGPGWAGGGGGRFGAGWGPVVGLGGAGGGGGRFGADWDPMTSATGRDGRRGGVRRPPGCLRQGTRAAGAAPGGGDRRDAADDAPGAGRQVLEGDVAVLGERREAGAVRHRLFAPGPCG